MNKDINRELNSFRGFTLIELLAVIVVLAIIILIAVNAVLPAMENARRSSFAIEANAAVDAAQAYFMSADLIGSGNGLPSTGGGQACVTIKELIEGGYSDLNPEEYHGYVVVQKGAQNSNNENRYFYTIWIEKGEAMMINGKGSEGTDDGQKNVDITQEHVDDYIPNADNNGFAKALPSACDNKSDLP